MPIVVFESGTGIGVSRVRKMPTPKMDFDIRNACRQQAFFFGCDFAVIPDKAGAIPWPTKALCYVQLIEVRRPWQQHGKILQPASGLYGMRGDKATPHPTQKHSLRGSASIKGALRRVLTRSLRFASGCGFRARP